MRRRRFWPWFWLALGAIYFFVPLLATGEFSLRAQRDTLSLLAYQRVLQDNQFISSFLFSLRMVSAL